MRLEKRLGVAVLLASACLVETASTKPFVDYIKPTPTVALLSSASWGVAGVLPRDLSNGIESAKGAGVHPEYYYWDGQIIRAKDGKYHLFMSTFSGNNNFGTAWQSSDAYRAVSESNVLGPYERQDYVYSNNGSHKGHNVSALELPDGTYAVIVSETVPFTIYKSSSLEGPWTSCQPTSQVGASNVSLVARHDGSYQIVERNGTTAIADTLCGTYVKQKPTCAYAQNATDSIYPKRTSIPGVSNPTYTWQEDPHVWRSAGVYHVIYSGSGDRVGWHVYSTDGLSWKDNGYAWSPREYQKLFCYEGTSTCTQWYKMERPGVVLQDGHPTHITWAVADVDKDNQVLPGTNHGTKVIVVPFDGVAFDNDFGVGGSSGGMGGTGGSAGGSTSGGESGTGGSGGSHDRAGAGGGGTSGGVGGKGDAPEPAEAIGGGGVMNHGGGGQSVAAGSPPVAGAKVDTNADAASDDGGCGCRVSRSTGSTSLIILAFVGLLSRARARRRAVDARGFCCEKRRQMSDPAPSAVTFALNGQVALVTGAARGLGRAIALALARAGADVVLGLREQASGTELAAEISELGRRALPVQMDITQRAQITAAVAEAIAQFGRIDILVNNAGIGPPAPAVDVTEQDFDHTLNVNLKGTFFVSQEVGRHMIQNRHGKIVMLSSQAGFVGLPTESVYCMTKAAIAHLTKCLAVEWGPQNVNVNAIAPTFIRTPGTAKWLENEGFRRDLLGKIPLGRVGEPVDVCGAVVFLASPAAALINGATLLIDGGFTAR